MAGALIGQAALGVAFGEIFAGFYKTVKNVTNDTLMFDSILEHLKSTLAILEPFVEEIQQSNRELGRPEEEIKGLIEKMKKAWSARNVLQTLQGVNDIRGQFNLVGMSGVGLACAVPRPPNFIVGLDVPLKEVKMKLLEEVSVLLLTAPGGCGKTTLVKMLCQDEEIKELYELDEDDSIANLLELIARNLASLEDFPWKHASDFASCYSEDFISQHDLLRELAMHQSNLEPVEQRKRLIVDISGNNLPKWWIEHNLKPINARLLSISTDEMFPSTWFNIQPLEVEVLVLNFQTKNYTFPDFVKKMDKLKVLIVTNCGFSHAELGSFHLPGSVPCLKRIVLENVSVPSLCKSLEQLRSLEKISLLRCNIGQAFKSIQVSNALPNLVEMNIDLCEDIAELLVDLCDIICLKKLSITNCYKFSALPQGIGKLVNLEVLRLRACINLLNLPESIRSLHNLTIFDTSYCLKMMWFPEHIGEFCRLEELHMEACLLLSNQLYRQWSNQLPPLFQNLKQLKLVTCDEEMSNLWEPVKEFHTSVKVKVIRSSGLIIRRVGLIFAGAATESTSLYGHNSPY
ncbi:hypothetical protein F2P56_026461 [Juglans regia]|uniref:RPW8 domain-containing protein n=2 Tax=Juglans regia TaxID=51240 RepID=A0A833U820_JUGRE|nr:probable disease resistance protein At5g66900 isoform X2 [Juglans regia]KAF5451348.1 hypothetical protein F2P56_026461 [Juglans regia]